jgi:hypothetical protein
VTVGPSGCDRGASSCDRGPTREDWVGSWIESRRRGTCLEIGLPGCCGSIGAGLLPAWGEWSGSTPTALLAVAEPELGVLP